MSQPFNVLGPEFINAVQFTVLDGKPGYRMLPLSHWTNTKYHNHPNLNTGPLNILTSILLFYSFVWSISVVFIYDHKVFPCASRTLAITITTSQLGPDHLQYLTQVSLSAVSPASPLSMPLFNFVFGELSSQRQISWQLWSQACTNMAWVDTDFCHSFIAYS